MLSLLSRAHTFASFLLERHKCTTDSSDSAPPFSKWYPPDESIMPKAMGLFFLTASPYYTLQSEYSSFPFHIPGVVHSTILLHGNIHDLAIMVVRNTRPKSSSSDKWWW